MKPRLSHHPEAGMTLFEVGLVVAVVMILVVLFLRLAQPRAQNRIGCVNNLKQVGLAYRIWSGDNGDTYPMGISVTNGGSREMVATGNVVQTFQAMSNELSTPKILFCPEDRGRTMAGTFFGLSNSNLSYFVGVDVTNEANPLALLSGDGNFEVAGKPVRRGLALLWTNDPVAWSAARHGQFGNLCLGDGSVQSVLQPGLHGYFVNAGMATNRLAIP